MLSNEPVILCIADNGMRIVMSKEKYKSFLRQAEQELLFAFEDECCIRGIV